MRSLLNLGSACAPRAGPFWEFSEDKVGTNTKYVPITVTVLVTVPTIDYAHTHTVNCNRFFAYRILLIDKEVVELSVVCLMIKECSGVTVTFTVCQSILQICNLFGSPLAKGFQRAPACTP